MKYFLNRQENWLEIELNECRIYDVPFCVCFMVRDYNNLNNLALLMQFRFKECNEIEEAKKNYII